MTKWHLIILQLISLSLSAISSYSKAQTSESPAPIPALVNALDLSFKKYKLTKIDLIELGRYSAMYYEPINAGLRQKDLNLLPTMSPQICKLDTVLAKFPISAGAITVYRGHAYLPEGADQAGYQFTSRAFTSTSLSKDVVVTRFLHKGVRVLDTITLPTDRVHSFWLSPVSISSDEYEILLPRDLQFEVVDVNHESTTSDSGETVTTVLRSLKILGFDKSPDIEKALHCPH